MHFETTNSLISWITSKKPLYFYRDGYALEEITGISKIVQVDDLLEITHKSRQDSLLGFKQEVKTIIPLEKLKGAIELYDKNKYNQD